MMADTGVGTSSKPLVRRYRLPRDMAVNPLHGIGGKIKGRLPVRTIS